MPQVLIVGAGFAGYHAARTLSRLAKGRAEITLLNPNDYFLYMPLLPEVATGVLEPRRAAVSLIATLPDVRLALGQADGVDLPGRQVGYTDPEGAAHTLGYDRLVLAMGSVNKLLPIPGVTRYAHGFRGIPEALYLRDHLIGQIELAAATDDARQRAARCSFVVVGAGYTGTEVAAHGTLFTAELAAQYPPLKGLNPQWTLVEIADRVLPELDQRLSRTASRVLRQRGVRIRTGTSVAEATADGVRLSDGENIPTRTLVWCVGVRPDPLAANLGLPTTKGRLVVDEYLNVPGHPEVFACGDAAAVPDPGRPGQITAMTAQHAVRHGNLVAHNIAASYGTGRRKPYRHHDLGFAVDLGGADAVANPVKVSLSGVAAKAITRGYHLMSMPGNRLRVVADWALDALQPRQLVQLGLVPAHAVPLESATPERPAL
jgi:NADH dehydrogenase